jgi:hypothetical protein
MVHSVDIMREKYQEAGMNTTTDNKPKSQHSLFLFFLSGLFLLQIAFAFTIHGDIGPQTDALPGLERPASPVLVGRIDSLINEANIRTAVKVAPEGMFAPATRDYARTPMPSARIDTELSGSDDGGIIVQKNSDRLIEYRIRPGDTLEKISKKLYGSTQHLQALIRLNRITDDRTLQQGALIKAPRAGLLSSIKVNN